MVPHRVIRLDDGSPKGQSERNIMTEEKTQDQRTEGFVQDEIDLDLVAQQGPFALNHARIVRAFAGEGGLGQQEGAVDEDQTVLVDPEGKIEAVFPSSEQDRVSRIPADYRQVDVRGRCLMPGLINVHVHLFNTGESLPSSSMTKEAQAEQKAFMDSPEGHQMLRSMTRKMARELLLSGVTSFRSVGDVAFDTVDLREDVEAGKALGGHILASGPMIAAPNGHGAPLLSMECFDADSTRANITRLVNQGVNAVKIASTGGVTDAQKVGDAGHPQMTEENMRIICQIAHENGIIVAAHAQSLEGVKRALRAGVDTIEHGCDFDQECIDLFHDNPHSLRGWSAVVPTLSAVLPLVKLDQEVTELSDVVRANATIIGDRLIAGAKKAVEAKLHLGVGTDTAMPYVTQYNTWRELDYLVRYAGLTPAQAIYAATQENALILGLDQVTGDIQPGLDADLLLLDNNPLDDLRALSKPVMVAAGGIVIDNPQPHRFEQVDKALDTF